MRATDLRTLIFRHLAVGVVTAAAVGMIWGPQPAASFAIGSALMAANLLILSWVWGRFFAKKSIAWTVMIIVIKYTVLLGAIFFLTRSPWFHVLSCGLGMATFIFAALYHAALLKKE